MRAVESDSFADFADIYESDVELVSVTPPRATTALDIAALARHSIKARWSQTAGNEDITAEQVKRAVDAPESDTLTRDINTASQLMADLFGCKSVGIRVVTLNGPMCPKFHTDYVPCRMIMNLMGPGTEWIANSDVDPDAFSDRSATSVPILEGKSVRHLESGTWSLLKGGRWDADAFDGVVHRSPHYRGDRLLVSIDPIFEGPDA